jgi:hypothetical protein
MRQHTATAIPYIYSFSGNCAASAPIYTFMCLWAINIFPGSVHIFPTAKKADPSWEYIIRSQTHECGNWDWGPDIPFLGIFVSNFRHFVFAVQEGVFLCPVGGSVNLHIGRNNVVIFSLDPKIIFNLINTKHMGFYVLVADQNSWMCKMSE